MRAVSVVVPCYNAAMYLDKCIEQLLHQTIGAENMEIILVNDASTDDGRTWELIMRYERQYPDIIMAISLEENMRQGGARNVGVSYASGEYLIFCDADDWLLEETLEHCYRAAKEYDADVVEFLIRNVTDHGLTIELVKGDGDRLTELDTEDKRRQFLLTDDPNRSLGSQKKLYRLSLIQENNIAFAEHVIFEEPSFMLPVCCYIRRHYFLDESLYICYRSPESTVRGVWGEHKWDNPKVWMHLIDDLESRGFLQRYYPELEYLFFSWGFGLSIRLTLQKGYVLTKEEFLFLKNMVTRMFPSIRENPYIEQDQSGWGLQVMALLDLEATDDNMQAVNDRKYI